MSIATIVAENLHALRLARNLPQTAVAKKAGFTVSYISMLERGERTPPLETLEALAKALHVDPVDLLQEGAAKGTRSRKR